LQKCLRIECVAHFRMLQPPPHTLCRATRAPVTAAGDQVVDAGASPEAVRYPRASPPRHGHVLQFPLHRGHEAAADVLDQFQPGQCGLRCRSKGRSMGYSVCPWRLIAGIHSCAGAGYQAGFDAHRDFKRSLEACGKPD
jgi:hypothetical protein